MTFSITAAAKASNNSHLHIGDGTDDAPRIQLVFIAHKDSLRSRNVIAMLGFCRYDTQSEQAVAVQCRTEFTRHLLVGGKRDNLCKTLTKDRYLRRSEGD